jgi:hypothetical protein
LNPYYPWFGISKSLDLNPLSKSKFLVFEKIQSLVWNFKNPLNQFKESANRNPCSIFHFGPNPSDSPSPFFFIFPFSQPGASPFMAHLLSALFQTLCQPNNTFGPPGLAAHSAHRSTHLNLQT